MDPSQAQDLLELAKSHTRANRELLLENVADLFLSPEGRLTERDRSVMTDILGKLVDDVEAEVRRALSERLAVLADAPRELVLKLSQDEIKIARPLLLGSPVLKDADLIDLVKQRTQEHRLTIAMRAGIGVDVADALVEKGEEDVIEALIRNGDAQLSRQAIDFLVEESRRIDRFQEPLLRRQDLPSKLAFRMFWWVSAVLRQQILTDFTIDESDLDDAVESAVHASVSKIADPSADAVRLAGQLHQRAELNDRMLVRALRDGHIAAFTAGLARLAGIDDATARRIVFATGGEALIAACKAAEFDRGTFATIYLLTRQSRLAAGAIAPDELDAVLRVYDKSSRDQARTILRYWRRDQEYMDAMEHIAERKTRG